MHHFGLSFYDLIPNNISQIGYKRTLTYLNSKRLLFVKNAHVCTTIGKNGLLWRKTSDVDRYTFRQPITCSTFTRIFRSSLFASLVLRFRAMRRGLTKGILAPYPPSAARRHCLGSLSTPFGPTDGIIR